MKEGISLNRWARWLCGLLWAMTSVGCEDLEQYSSQSYPLEAYCQANVSGVGYVDTESDYLPHVINCENGGAGMEALKAQAVAARSFLYYKMNLQGYINDGTGDQVYSCGREPGPEHHQAVQATSGQVLMYSGDVICAFYVAGAIPSTANCISAPGDSDPTSTEKWVTYNEGLSGDNIHQSNLGWVDPGNIFNRGCKSQNGSACLHNQGRPYTDIVRFYYGEDIQLVTALGSCVVTPTEPVGVEGHVYLAGGDPLPGVAVRVIYDNNDCPGGCEKIAVTDGQGWYRVDDIPARSGYEIMPSGAGWGDCPAGLSCDQGAGSPSPWSRSGDLGEDDLFDQNFTYQLLSQPQEDVASPQEDVSSPRQDVASPQEDVSSPRQDVPSSQQDVPSSQQDVPPSQSDWSSPPQDLGADQPATADTTQDSPPTDLAPGQEVSPRYDIPGQEAGTAEPDVDETPLDPDVAVDPFAPPPPAPPADTPSDTTMEGGCSLTPSPGPPSILMLAFLLLLALPAGLRRLFR